MSPCPSPPTNLTSAEAPSFASSEILQGFPEAESPVTPTTLSIKNPAKRALRTKLKQRFKINPNNKTATESVESETLVSKFKLYTEYSDRYDTVSIKVFNNNFKLIIIGSIEIIRQRPGFDSHCNQYVKYFLLNFPRVKC